ncbi:type II secretion system GspH family protein [Clostridium sp. LY3-2]|uniref:type II secretion system protein n=1 Tax=Clostridium sp. LY3-2 TaxID=2942482 RepID=UPI0021529AC0|nr:type II secretion system protein [Clostridium sp. LY3-2]MCR6514824.1 type II secretion system GspH family protein [Clostridium sp. LY3-2]
MNKIKKIRGFTLLELVAVIAIILVLVSIFMPKIQGYFLEAKKVLVIDQARNIRMSVIIFEESNNKEFKDISVLGFTNNTVGAVKNYYGTSKLLEDQEIEKLSDDISLDIIYEIVENRRDFKVNSSGEFVGLI